MFNVQVHHDDVSQSWCGQSTLKAPTLVEAHIESGLEVELTVYQGGRHEMLGEANRTEVVGNLIVLATQGRKRHR